MKVLIMAGGTGGHVFPALALAEALRARGHAVTWLGTAQKIEAKVVPKAGFEIDFLEIQSLKGRGALAWFMLPFRLAKAVKQAMAVMQKRKPDLVVGLGGFVSGPGGLAAKKLKVPLVIHEQNALAGLTNRILARFATAVYTGFDGAFKSGVKTETIGNPLRKSFIEQAKHLDSRLRGNDTSLPLKILVVGGSLGAQAFNQKLPAAFALLPQDQYEIWHQAGEKTLAEAQKRYQELNVKANVVAFIDDMPNAYQWADIVICRAGALTVSELAAMGKAAILIPLPTAADDHQRFNAEYLSKQNAGICLLQKDLYPEKLSNSLTPFLSDPNALIEMGKKARGLAKLEATEILVQRCEALLSRDIK